ncbi:MAG: division/cell wall cluster transcriptional repressor MraZ [Gemmatimonadota bacterium]
MFLTVTHHAKLLPSGELQNTLDAGITSRVASVQRSGEKWGTVVRPTAGDGRDGAGEAAEERTINFLGSYTYQIDGKGRVSLPAAFRREASDQAFVLIQAHPPALTLYPQETWSEVKERMRDLLRHQPEARSFVLRMTANALEVNPDGQGRILIPSRLKEAAHLDGEALLVGALDKVEIWNPKRFEEAVEEEEAEGYERFAPQIFR